jgi:hypothetical protein
MQRVRRTLMIAVVAVAGLAGAAPALATTQSAHAGNVKATFTFHGSAPNYSGQRLRIERAGTVVYDKPVVAGRCGGLCGPGGVHASSVHVLDLEHSGQPDVVLDLFSGGAHCCFIEQVFSYAASAHTYLKTERDLGDPGAQIKDLGHDGHLEFLSADDRFANQFTDFADSGLPIQIWTFKARRFMDVTRAYPPLIAKDASVWLTGFKTHHANGEGFIAAWAADEDLLGHTSLVKSTLATEQQRGHLNGPIESGAKFVSDLQKFLRKLGYTH